MTELDQLEAIEAVLAGDLAAFDQLVAHLEPSVLRVAHGISNDADRAHDIAQDAFVAAYRQLTQYDSHRAKFSTWLLTITKNLAIKSNRKNGRLNSMTTSESHEPTESAPPPSEALQWRETFSALDRALIQLPAKWRTALCAHGTGVALLRGGRAD